MKLLDTLHDRVAGELRATGAGYADGADRPLRGYLTAMGVYTALVGVVAAGTRLAGREVPDGLSPADIALSAIATHKLSRLLTRDAVTSPLRAPFTAYQGSAGAGEVTEEVRGTGGRKVVGEMVTSPFSAGMWIATAVTAGLIYLPRTTRLVTGTLTALSGSDLLQYGHALLAKAAE
jgi:hypothetical protein